MFIDELNSARGLASLANHNTLKKLQNDLRFTGLDVVDSLINSQSIRGLASLAINNSYEKLQNDLGSHIGLAEAAFTQMHSTRGLASLAESTALEKLKNDLRSAGGLGVLDSFNKSSLNQGIKSFLNDSVLNELVLESNLHLRSAALIANSFDISELYSIRSKDRFHSVSNDILDEEAIKQQLTSITESQDAEKIADLFNQLPEWLRYIFISLSFIALYLVFPSIVDTYIKNFAECHLPLISCQPTEKEIDQPLRKELNSFKSLLSDNSEFIYFRFVSQKYLNVYVKPNQKSEIVDELTFGQTILLIQKDRNWSKINFRNELGEIAEGWVFSRYLKKFN